MLNFKFKKWCAMKRIRLNPEENDEQALVQNSFKNEIEQNRYTQNIPFHKKQNLSMQAVVSLHSSLVCQPNVFRSRVIELFSK